MIRIRLFFFWVSMMMAFWLYIYILSVHCIYTRPVAGVKEDRMMYNV